MRIRLSKTARRHLFSVVLVALASAVFLWMMSGFVRAYWVEKTVHIFPTNVSATGWNGAEHALKQDLSAKATFDSFRADTSASIILPASGEPRKIEEVVPQPLPEDVPPEFPPMMLNPELPQSVETPVTNAPVQIDLPEPVMISTTTNTTVFPTFEATSTASTSVPILSIPETATHTPETIDLPLPLISPPEDKSPEVEPVSTSSTTTSAHSQGGSLLGKTANTLLDFARSKIGTTVFATSTPEELFSTSTATTTEVVNSPVVTDVALCTTEGKPCYTVQLSGFGVTGELREKALKTVTLNFSFGAKFPDTEMADNKLIVRYFHAGRWRQTGEIFLNKELSNASNGGYFTSTLDDVSSWDDLSDLQVVVEFARLDSSVPAELYLDGVWLDVMYKDRAQQVLEGEAEIKEADVPENVGLALQGSELDAFALDLPGGQVSFKFIDKLGAEGLVIRSDKASYTAHTSAEGGGNSDSIVYASVTNTGPKEDSFSLIGAYLEGKGTISNVAQYFHNVATSTHIPVRKDVTYFCDAGWQGASSSESYTCVSSGEEESCISLSNDGTKCTVPDVTVGENSALTYENAWVDVPLLSNPPMSEEFSGTLPSNYSVVAATNPTLKILPGQTIYLRITLNPEHEGVQNFMLIARGDRYVGNLDSSLLRDEAAWKVEKPHGTNRFKKASINTQLSAKTNFDGDELPSFRFKFKSQISLFTRMRNWVFRRSNDFSLEHARLRHAGLKDQEIAVDAVYSKSGEWSLSMKKLPRSFRPGKYSIELTMQEGGQTFTDSVDFTWGVLAVNTNKTLYEPGDTAHFMMAALSDAGDTICDANLQLTVTSPSGSSESIPVILSGLCGQNNVVDVADYSGDFPLREVGTYQISLARVDNSGGIINRIEDSFAVQNDIAYDVERTGPTRIYPKAPYKMGISVTARHAFTGTVTEAIPIGTLLDNIDGGTLAQYGGAVRLSWHVSLKAGETKKLSYTFDAPDISPYLYVFGPLDIDIGKNRAFEEYRTWKIASDALGSYVEKNVSWAPTVAGSWQAKDLSGAPYSVPANAVLEIAIVNNDAATARIAGVRHASSSLTRSLNINRSDPDGAEGEFTMHVQASATSSIQTFAADLTHISFVLLGYWTSGYYVETFNQIDPNIANNTWGNLYLNPVASGVASGTIAEMIVGNWNTTNERNAGVRNASSSLARLANIHQSTTAGVNGATMMVKALTASGTIQAFGQVEGANNADVDYWLAGYWSVKPTGLEYTERFDDLGQPSSTSTWTTKALDSFTVPANAAAEILFANNSATTTNMLLGLRAVGSSNDRTFSLHEAVGGGWVLGRAFVKADSTASSSIEYYSENLIANQFKLIGFWAATNTAPAAPTLYDSPFDSQRTGSSTPALKFSATDPEGTSKLVYQVQWSDQPVLDTSTLGDRLSSNESGCSPNCFQDLTKVGSTSPFTSGDQIEFTIQTPLVSGTTYYWRVRAVDVTGSNQYGDWSTTKSFTYIANTALSSWLQTQDAQFDTGTLNDTETYGSHSVRLKTSTLNAAMVAYGEGTVQTPRYRIWNGTSWGAQASAQSVGAAIQWSVLRAGTQRNEYVLGTQNSSRQVTVQVYSATTSTWGNLLQVGTVSTASRKGFDIAFESISGNAMVVYCDGDSDPSYRTWNGTSWSAVNTITTVSANNCEWIELAANPISNEIIMVERDTGAGYEAQVWNGTSSWGNAKTLGQASQPAHEGMAVQYEESGNQGMVVVSNNTSNNFLWTAWDGSIWSTNATVAITNDFAWAALKHDAGSDALALCYTDRSDGVGLVNWDGNSWGTVQSVDTTGRTDAGTGFSEGRNVSCEFETTAGRDGYVMVPYGDATASNVTNYTYWNGASLAANAAVNSILGTWTVGTTRTGTGLILGAFYDDTRSRYDFSSWDGSAWSPLQTLNNNSSVTATPFDEPISIAARVYQPTTGTITSAPINFSSVPGRSTWGEVLWNATEPTNTSVTMQVLYTSGGVCTSLVPDAVLAGNSTGFSTASSPINLTSVSTTTYSGLCLKATLTTTSGTSPTLDDWRLTWERSPLLVQADFRWYVNAAAALNPSDLWPAGVTDTLEDVAISADDAPSYGNALRLRMNIVNRNTTLSTSSQAFALQYAQGSTCSSALTWQNIGDVGSTTAAWIGLDNATLSDGATLSSGLLSSTTVAESYEEQNDTATNPNAIAVNGLGEWDWSLQHNALAGTSYCFRMITNDGQTLNSYLYYPSLITNSAPQTPILSKPFDNEKLSSTTPFFEFTADDSEGNDLSYQIQIDTSYTFSGPVVDKSSETDFTLFENIITTSDKDPYNANETVRFTPSSALTNGTTYYWRVRAKDRSNSNTWSSWSTTQSFTINSVTFSTWFQTKLDQFNTNTFDQVEATSTDDMVLTTPYTTGTTTSTAISYSSVTLGNSWGTLSWNAATTTGTIKTHVEYWTGSAWALVPDSDLSGNATGFSTSTVSLLSLAPSTYGQIRLRANFTIGTTTPRLKDWTVEWAYAVAQPTLLTLFDNEKTATTTPTFTFTTTDPQGQDLVYQFSVSSTTDFAASTTRTSDTPAIVGFTNTASTTDTSPFVSGNTIQYQMQPADALVNGRTYWWRIRAKDPGGGDAWSVWSALQSFTIDTSVTVSTWFQTTDLQFATDELDSTQTNGSGSVGITSTLHEAFTAYAEGTVQSPRYRIWNGTSWGSEQTAQSTGDTIRFVESAAAPTRDEYMIVTQSATGLIKAQVYNNASSSAGNLVSMSTASHLTRRGMDVAYETNTGKAMVVSCYGTEAVYRRWDGTSWSATSSISLSVSANCEFVKLIANPTASSNEIILIVRDATTGANDFEALVWSGSGWGNSKVFGISTATGDESIAAEYEESGNQALVAVANSTNNSLHWAAWSSGAWSASSTLALSGRFAGGRIVRDVGTDNMALCYVTTALAYGMVRWDGSAWAATQALTGAAPVATSRPISCEFETTSGRDGYIMNMQGNNTATATQYQFWNGTILSVAAAIDTIGITREVRSTRAGDGNILVMAYDSPTTDYDFSYWNGTLWSTEQILESTAITTTNPVTIPFDIVARRYPSITSGQVTSPSILFSSGTGPKWSSFSFHNTTPGASIIRYQIQYLDSSTGEWTLVPDALISGNAAGTTTSPVSLSGLNRITYGTLRLVANLICSGSCPTLDDWSVNWSAGISISGTAKQVDETTNVTSGTVNVAVNGTLQVGKTGTISGGTWTISNVTAFQDDIITVFIATSTAAKKAVAITKYQSSNDITGMTLYENHLTLGSDDNPTITNADINQYDQSSNSSVFHDVSAGNVLTVCYTGCVASTTLYIKNGTTFQPSSASTGNVTTSNLKNKGTFVPDGNTITVGNSWFNNGIFTKGASTIVFSATSTIESIDSSNATTTGFFNVTLGSGSGSAKWTLASPLMASGTVAINFGTLAPGSTSTIALGGDFTIGSSGRFSKSAASTTFNGSGSNTWTDNTSAKQDMGDVFIDGSAKTISLGAGAKATNITIGADDTLSAGSNYALEVISNWTNNNVFTAQSGTVTFSATTTGRTIAPGSSSFYNLTFNGSGGNWSFSTSTITVGNNFTLTNGTVTAPAGTTTVSGSFSNAGTFTHNNAVVLFNASGVQTIDPGASSFYDMTFNGTGSWSFTSANATSSRHVTITAGTLTAPSGTFAIAGSFAKNGGTFTHNSGTLKFTPATSQTLKLGGSDAYNLTFAGTATTTFSDTNATTTNTVRFESATSSLPSGTLAVGGSWINAGGAFSHNSGVVKFNATATGRSVSAGSSTFYDLVFDGVGGGWTITASATSTRNTSITNANSFTLTSGQSLEVGGTFTNSMGGATTTWTGSTLYLNSGTNYSLNTKTTGADAYATLLIGSGTNIKMWNSSASTSTVSATGSLYSQNNAAISGDLYIWGAYTATGSETWSYATDFDGTALGGSSRRVNVRIATSSTITFSSGTLSMIGSPTASTSVANQGAGSYTFNITGGTLNAQYYSIASTTPAGLSISGSTNITSLADGEFTLSTPSGGTSMTIAPATINQNPTLQIQRVRFATSTGVITGANVTVSGSPSSYWWFRNHYGNFAGENFDSDSGGNPGYVRWDDSNLSITISGRVYSDHGSSAIGNPPCDGSSVVKVVVGSGASYTGSCDAGTGAYSIPGVAIAGDVVVTTYLDSAGGKKAVAITKTPTTDISNMDLYENAIIVRHEDTVPITIADLAYYDNTKDTDIPFVAATNTPPHTLIVQPNIELFVWSGKTFAPGGNVTLQSGGSGDARDGRFYMSTSSVFTATGSESHSIGGGLVVSSGSTFTAANSTITFTATTTGKSINSSIPLSLYNVTFNGSGGGWLLDTAATTTVQNTFAMTAGTLSGTSSVNALGSVSGDGTISMSSGLFQLEGVGNFGGTAPWQFYNLNLGAGSIGTTTKTGVGTTTVTGVLRVQNSHVLQAGSAPLVLSGSGIPFVVGSSGIFTVQSALTYFTGTSSVTVADQTYGPITLAPALSGTPTYTLKGGTFTTTNLTLGGVNPVSVTADSNDPSVVIGGDLVIGSGSTLIASNVGVMNVGGSWTNNGTFTASGSTVTFNATATGKTITPGTSSFAGLTIDSVTGGWTIAGNATTTGAFTLSNAANFTLSPNIALAVGGTFTNSVGGSATTWATSTLYLNSGTSFAMNTKSTGNDVYGTLLVGPSTKVSSWNSSAATTTVNSTGSLYSQNHAGVSGDLYIWGAYTRSSGSDYWSHATDFDGVALGGSSRQVNVRIATSSSVTLSGGTLNIVGISTASTTIQVQGTGAYGFNVSGGTLNATYYSFRDLDSSGLNLSGTPAITSLDDGDFQLAVRGGSLISVSSSVIDANPLKIIARTRFATTTAITGSNVTEIGSPGSSWKFNLHYGNFAGEGYDTDPAGDPGYIRWDDSASQITIAGNVYSDEGSTVSTVCDNSTPVVRLKVQGSGTYTSSCASLDGAYSITNVSYNPGDVLTLFLDNVSGKRAANISVDPNTSVSNMHLYENRVIVRHEDTTPLTIAKMDIYDSGSDSDIPFTATLAATNTLVVSPNTKLIVWNGKTFAPGGNVTLQSGGSGSAWDGTLELYANAVFTAAGTEIHSIGGNLTVASNATITSANSTFTFTATTTGKTINPYSSSLYNMTFSGVGGNWSFSTSSVTATNNFIIATGTVTLAAGTTTVGGVFTNTGGTFMHNNGTLLLNTNGSGRSIQAFGSDFYNLSIGSNGGTYTFADTNATTSNNFIIATGNVTLPTGTFVVGSSFDASGGTFTNSSGTVKLTAVSTGKTIRANGSSFNTLTLNGVGGAWTFLDTNATTTDLNITNGSTTLPSGVLAIAGSLINAGTFTHNNGTVRFAASATGKSVTASSSAFYNVVFDGSSGGWTITGSATSTHDATIMSANTFTLNPNQTLAVGGTFTNTVGGSATTWATSTLYLYSGAVNALNTKSLGGDTYGTLLVGPSTKISMWNSSAATTTVDTTGSLYSQNHAAVSGSLYIWGAYTRSSGSDYWSYAKDFDGVALGGSSRAVSVRIATSSSVTLSGGTLEIVGTASATTTVQNQGAGRYALAVSGGTLNATYYQLRNIDQNGLNISGSPSITSLSYGDYELDVPSGGAMMTVSAAAVDANASLQITGNRFATSTGVTSGFNVVRSGSPVTAWTFSSHYGNYAGEAYDSDGGDACGQIRWSNSTCLFVSQEHFRWRNDDGGEGVPSTEWYNASWSKRQKVAITNNATSTYTNLPVKLVVQYDSDMRSDFGDLRFTDSTGTTSLNYWIESTVASASSTVWVSVPSLVASSSATIYMYYGNAATSSAASGTATFPFFEDFESNSLAGYSGDTSLFQTSTSFAHNWIYGLDAGSNSGQFTTTGLYRASSLFGQGNTIRFYQYVDASQQDEPCTLFAVQGSGSNYAVCLDEYPSQKVILAKNVTRNDGSGTVLASTTVSYTTGWYEVSIDWKTNNTISVNVYNSAGALFASVSANDSSYTSSGGLGFSFWYMHGGWDFYSVRSYVPSAPSYIFGAEQGTSGATWLAAEDTTPSGILPNQNVRVRFSIQNTGSQISAQLFRLQVAPKGGALNCESVSHGSYNDVPTTSGGCGSNPACMTTSSQFTDQSTTAGLLSYPASMSFASGRIMEDPSNQSASSTVGSNAATEVEYNFQMTNNASQSSYCFRSSNGGTDFDNYAHVAELVVLHPPQVSNFTLNSLQNIVLVEGVTTMVYATGTVTDLNGYADIISATSTIYRSGVGPDCTQDENNCYQSSAVSCTMSGCSGTSCALSCSVPVQYFADATDVGSTYAAENWLARVQLQDSTGLRDTVTSSGAEMGTLYALAITTGNIDFGSLSVGQNTGTVTATTTIQNTGNAGIDIQVSGTNLTDGSNTIAVGEQKYATTTFAYGSCSICQFLTGSATNVDLNIPKPTATATPSRSDLYWGINIPDGTAATLHQGTTTFIAVGQ